MTLAVEQQHEQIFKSYIDKDGYRQIYQLNGQYQKPTIPEHRFLYEQFYKCCLLRWGNIHHINGIKSDNKIENLEGMTGRQHRIHHHKDKHLSEETRKRISESEKGKKISEETRKKLSGHIPWNKGKKVGPYSEERNKKNSESHKGIKHSEETRKKMSESRKRLLLLQSA